MFSEAKFIVLVLYKYLKFLLERKLMSGTVFRKQYVPKCKRKANILGQFNICARIIVTYVRFIFKRQLMILWPPRNRPVVQVNQGKVRGVTATLPNGKDYHFFKGIPYAEPPVGKLRFQAPIPVEKFKTPEIDCHFDRSDFIQQTYFIGVVKGSEEELYLNVYTPDLPKDDTKLPVMVWIHGGGFNTGTISSFIYDPVYILQQGVVFVAMTYRLGALGFLSMPSVGIQGNAGLKDQVLAFKWIRNNISQFGGDPGNVTIFGESAGSMAAYLHYLSPNSSKYFHRVICQSGLTCSETFFQKDGLERARKLAKSLGCKGNSDEQILDTLQKASAIDLVTQQNHCTQNRSTDLALKLDFRPVIEQELTEISIITKTPAEILQSFDTFRMPFINGCNSGEGILPTAMMEDNWIQLNRDPSWFVPRFMNNLNCVDRAKVGRRIKEFYFGSKNVDPDNLQEMCNYKSDAAFFTNSVVNAEWMAKYQPNVRHYHYRFSYSGRYSFFKLFLNLSHLDGACHIDEIFHMFKSQFLPTLAEQSEEVKVRNNLIWLWTNFAKYGNPTPDDALQFKWNQVQPLVNGTKHYSLDALDIGINPKMVRDPCKDRIEFWRKTLQQHIETMLI